VYARDWFMLAEQDGKTIAMAITIPDMHQVYKKMQGRLLPTGIVYYLMRTRIIDRVRVGFLGVLPEYQHTGVAAALYMEHFDVAARRREQHARRASSSRSTTPCIGGWRRWAPGW
jgi:GNAT superfamily N-acetyltransferase